MLQITLDTVGTISEVGQIAAEAAVGLNGVNYEVIQEQNAQWPTIVGASLDYGELVSFASKVYVGETVEDFGFLIKAI